MIACSLHTRTIAGWSCTACHRALCPECAGWRSEGVHRITVCMRCGGTATRLRTHRSIRHPYRYSLLGTLGWPLSLGGVATLFCLAAVVFGLGLAGRYGRVAGCALVLTWLLQIVRKSASGSDEVPGPEEFRGVLGGVLGPALRAALALVWVVLPFALWFFVSGASAAAQPALRLDAAAIACALFGLLLAPLAMLVAALDSPLQLIVNPFAMVGLTFDIGVDYWLCTLACALCAGGTWLMQIAGRSLARAHAPPAVLGFLGLLLLLYLPLVAFRALGLLVRARGDRLGYGSADFYRVPILDARPVHEVKPPEQKLIEIEPRFAQPPELGISAPGIVINLPDPAASIAAPVPLLPLEDDPASEWFVSQASAPDAPAAPAEAVAGATLRAEAAPAEPISSVRATVTPNREERIPPSSAPRTSTPVPHLPSVLAQKMAARDLTAAREALRAGAQEIPAGTLSAASWNELARAFSDDAGKTQGADRAGLAELALTACKRGLEVAPEGQLAPRMWLTAARLCDEMLRDRARSNEMLAELARRFPESPEGVFANKRLGAPPKQRSAPLQDKPGA